MAKKEKHIHKFKRHVYSTGNKVYFCTLPDCQFKINIEFALGKESLCNRCGKPFLMNVYSMRLAKPHCEDCHNLNRKDEHGGDRRILPSRRELDPTVIPQLAENSLDSLRERLNREVEEELSETNFTSIDSILAEDSEDEGDDLDL